MVTPVTRTLALTKLLIKTQAKSYVQKCQTVEKMLFWTMG